MDTPFERRTCRCAGAWLVGIAGAVLAGAVSQPLGPNGAALTLASRLAVGASQPSDANTAADVLRVQEVVRGALLVASRRLGDPNFVETVIVLIDHGETGTAGLVVNRQTDVPLSRVFQELPQAERQSAPLYVGGPVSTTAVQALVRSRAAVPQGRHVVDDIHVLGARRALEERLTRAIDPSQFRVYLGYAGWAPAQLEREIGAGAWHVLPAEADVVFDADPDTLWRRLIRRSQFLRAGLCDVVPGVVGAVLRRPGRFTEHSGCAVELVPHLLGSAAEALERRLSSARPAPGTGTDRL